MLILCRRFSKKSVNTSIVCFSQKMTHKKRNARTSGVDLKSFIHLVFGGHSNYIFYTYLPFRQ